jgi:hypothetical protein
MPLTVVIFVFNIFFIRFIPLNIMITIIVIIVGIDIALWVFDYMKSDDKNPKKLIFRLGIVAVVVIILIIIAVISMSSRVDHIETTKSYRPFQHIGYNYTYQQVFDHFIERPNWTYSSIGDGAEVTVQGLVPYVGHTEIVISVMPVPGERNLFYINPVSVTIGGGTLPGSNIPRPGSEVRAVGPLLEIEIVGMFGAYAQGIAWEGLVLMWETHSDSNLSSQHTNDIASSGTGNNIQNNLVGVYRTQIEGSAGRTVWYEGGEIIHFYDDGTGVEYRPYLGDDVTNFTWDTHERGGHLYLNISYSDMGATYRMSTDFTITLYEEFFDGSITAIILHPYGN